MPPPPPTAFFSYSRADSEFALRLAEDLKAAGANVWLDQLDIAPGQRWARALQDALNNSPRVLVILSPSAVNSTHVEDEVNFALDEHRIVIPVFYQDCKVPFQLRPFQYVDFRNDYARGLKVLLKTLGVEQQVAREVAADHSTSIETLFAACEGDVRKRTAGHAPTEEGRQQVAQQPSKANFLDIDAVHKLISSSGLLASDEVVVHQLLILKTTRQRTWIVVTTQSVFCVLDDEKTRSKGTEIQWRQSISDSLRHIKTRPSKSKPATRGLLDIGLRHSWLYSKNLHPNSKQLEEILRTTLFKQAELGRLEKERRQATAKKARLDQLDTYIVPHPGEKNEPKC